MIERTDIYELLFSGNIGYGAYTNVVKAALSYPFLSFYLFVENNRIGLSLNKDLPPVMYTPIQTGDNREYEWVSYDCTGLTPDITDAQFEPITTITIEAVFVLDATHNSDPFYWEVEDGNVSLYLCREPYSPLTTYPWSFYVGDVDYLWMHIEGAPSTCDDYAAYYGVAPIDMSRVDYMVWFWGDAGQSYCLPFSIEEEEGSAATTQHSVVSYCQDEDLQAPPVVEQERYSTLTAGRRIRLRCSVPLSPDDYQKATAIAGSPYYYYLPQCYGEKTPFEIYDITRCHVEDFSTSWEYGDGTKAIEITLTRWQ